MLAFGRDMQGQLGDEIRAGRIPVRALERPLAGRVPQHRICLQKKVGAKIPAAGAVRARFGIPLRQPAD